MFQFFGLFAFWLLLSQKFDILHITAGIIASGMIVWGTSHILRPLPFAFPGPPFGKMKFHHWLRFLSYLPWLVGRIFLANLHIMYVVLHPKMPIQPRIMTFRPSLPHAWAQLMLANSITLTPGTVTIDVDKEDFTVHTLTQSARQDLFPNEGPSEMERRVAAIWR